MELVQKYKELSKHYELKANTYINLIKNIEGGEKLYVILPDIIDNQILEINKINEKYKKIISDLKDEYENKIKIIEEERDYWKYKNVEEFLSDDEDYTSDDDFDY